MLIQLLCDADLLQSSVIRVKYRTPHFLRILLMRLAAARLVLVNQWQKISICKVAKNKTQTAPKKVVGEGDYTHGETVCSGNSENSNKRYMKTKTREFWTSIFKPKIETSIICILLSK